MISCGCGGSRGTRPIWTVSEVRLSLWSGPRSSAVIATSLCGRLWGCPPSDLGAEMTWEEGYGLVTLEVVEKYHLCGRTTKSSKGSRDEGPEGFYAGSEGREASVHGRQLQGIGLRIACKYA